MKTDCVTPLPECHEGPESFRRFDSMMGKLLSVSRAVLAERERAYREQSARNPNRRGPKPKVERRRVSSARVEG